jgi:hypothetical protein
MCAGVSAFAGAGDRVPDGAAGGHPGPLLPKGLTVTLSTNPRTP